ncbi:MAG: response regulator, partial [Bacteroidia bacterium]
MDPSRIKVLYVDDEVNNLISFKANFRSFFEVYTAISAEEGKAILSRKDIHVLITDQRMPGISGVRFLESVIKEFPFPVRIILTGYMDIETIIEAINKGQIYRYILKPFDAEELKQVIENAYDLYLFRKSSKEALVKYRQLFEKSNDTIFLMDLNGYFRELNNFGFNLFKIKEYNLRTFSFQSLFEHPKAYKDIFAQLLRSEAVIDYPAKLKDTEGNSIDALISATPIMEQDFLVGYQCMIRDITKQKEVENLVIRTIIDTQEKERIRLGKNLHDGIGSRLAAIKLFIHEFMARNDGLKNDPALVEAAAAVNDTILDLRSICFNIMPKSLEVLGLSASVKELCRQNQVLGSLEFDVIIQDDFPKLSLQVELAIFRIVQEFISNSIRHAGANQIKIEFRSSDQKLRILLKDNGIGFEVNQALRGP